MTKLGDIFKEPIEENSRRKQAVRPQPPAAPDGWVQQRYYYHSGTGGTASNTLTLNGGTSGTITTYTFNNWM